MKPVDQTRFGNPGGNCFQAALASILELPLEEVPDFCNENWDGDWASDLNEWLSARGLLCVCFDVKEMDADWITWMTDKCYCLASVISAITEGATHAVVYYKGCVVHDPHPSRRHLQSKPLSLDVFVALDPSKVYKLYSPVSLD
jgi:hypothetical protein